MSGSEKKSTNERILLANRRSFLKSVGNAALALPFYRLLEQSAFSSTSVTKPLCFIGIAHEHGRATEYWRPKSNFDISYANSSLAVFDDPQTYGVSFRDKILVIDDIDNKANIDVGKGAHDSFPAMLTGSSLYTNDNRPQSPSLDQYLARTLGLGNTTPYPTVNCGFRWRLSYGTGGVPMPEIKNPLELWNMYFKDLIVSAEGAELQLLAAQKARRQSSIDYLVDAINRLNSRLGTLEKQKLDQHLTAMREIERRLQTFATQPGTCIVPPQPVLDFPGPYQDPLGDSTNDAFADLIGQLIVCDLTRFVTWKIRDADEPLTQFNPVIPEDVHQLVAHRYVSTPNPTPAEAQSQIDLANSIRYHYSKVARLMRHLHESGNLDNSLLLITSELGSPSLHSITDVPFIIAGGCNGAFQMGRHVRWEKPNKTTYNPHNRVLVSVANAFGANIDRFGHSPQIDTTIGHHPGL